MSGDERDSGALAARNDQSIALIEFFFRANLDTVEFRLGNTFCRRKVLCGLSNKIDMLSKTTLKGQDTDRKTDHFDLEFSTTMIC